MTWSKPTRNCWQSHRPQTKRSKQAMGQANYVRIFEVGARDGLQNEGTPLSPQLKAELINRLASAGIRHIEAGSFVSPKWVPQMASSDQVFQLIERRPGVTYSALTPDRKSTRLNSSHVKTS